MRTHIFRMLIFAIKIMLYELMELAILFYIFIKTDHR